LLASVPGPHTAVNDTSRLRGAPSADIRVLNFFRVPGPQEYTLTTECNIWLSIYEPHEIVFSYLNIVSLNTTVPSFLLAELIMLVEVALYCFMNFPINFWQLSMYSSCWYGLFRRLITPCTLTPVCKRRFQTHHFHTKVILVNFVFSYQHVVRPPKCNLLCQLLCCWMHKRKINTNVQWDNMLHAVLQLNTMMTWTHFVSETKRTDTL